MGQQLLPYKTSMNERVKEKLNLLPALPGCYLMKNIDKEIIYVGKAKKLTNRVNSYFNRPHSGKTEKMVSEIEDFDFIVTPTEKDALILEMNLIHRHMPKYNILLKDGKAYPYIQITSYQHPNIQIARNIKDKKAKYFGPYPDSSKAYEIIRLLDRLFPLRKCRNLPKKACLYYHLGQCLAPCINEVKKEQYDDIIKQITAFLKGDVGVIKKELTEKMYAHSEKLEFELASEYKKLIDSIDYVITNQTVQFKDKINCDVFAFHSQEDYLSVSTMMYRDGILIAKMNNVFAYFDEIEDALINYIYNFYQDHLLPKQIIVPDFEESELLGEVLGVEVLTPNRGSKSDLLQTAAQNAIMGMQEKFATTNLNKKDKFDVLEDLAKLLGLHSVQQIEMIDNSHLQGSNAVSGVIVFIAGEPSKRDYRKYKIKGENTKADTDSMYEVMYRRHYRKIVEQTRLSNLIIVDGGITQIHAAKKALTDLNLQIPVVGLVKDEHHRTKALINYEGTEFPMVENRDLLHFLTKMQDEVHRFAISYHRELRSKSITSSILDDIQGIGPKRKEALLKAFGSTAKMKEASMSELEQFIPFEVAIKLKERLNSH